MAKLDGKVAIVTGAARGLGRAYAKRLAGLGAKVAVADLNLRSYEESSDAGAISAAPMRGRSRRRRPRRASSAGAMPSAFLCGADSELYPVAPRLLAKRIETGRRTLSAPAKAAMPADLAWASCKLWSKALTLRRRRSGLS